MSPSSDVAWVKVDVRGIPEVIEEIETYRRMLDVFMPPCSQCGQRFWERACGPTHAVIQADPGRHDRARWWCQ